MGSVFPTNVIIRTNTHCNGPTITFSDFFLKLLFSIIYHRIPCNVRMLNEYRDCNIIFIISSRCCFVCSAGLKDILLIVRLLQSSKSTPTPPPLDTVYYNIRTHVIPNRDFQAQSQFPKRRRVYYYIFYV